MFDSLVFIQEAAARAAEDERAAAEAAKAFAAEMLRGKSRRERGDLELWN